MVNINGTYELAENQNFHEFLLKSGVPNDLALKMSETKSVFTATLVGDKFSIKVESSPQNTQKSEYILNKEVDEVLHNETFKSIAKLDGDVLTITSKKQDVGIGQRIYKFTETGSELAWVSEDGSKSAKIIYKRV